MTHRTKLFLNENVAGVLGLQEPFQKVQVHVLNDTVEIFQSMPFKTEIESVDGQFSEEISMKTCPQKVTGNYRVVNWTEHQNKWPHLTQWSFAKPANNRLVDLLVRIDNAELHYSHVDLWGKRFSQVGKRKISCSCSLERWETRAPWHQAHGTVPPQKHREKLKERRPCCQRL